MSAPTGTKRPIILLVDDEKTVLDSLVNQLHGAYGRQFVYEPATTTEEAWEVLHAAQANHTPVALVISDWMMPQQKGDSFLADVHKAFPDIPKAMLSGYADAESVERCRQQVNLLAYIAKPWEAEHITALVQQLVTEEPAMAPQPVL